MGYLPLIAILLTILNFAYTLLKDYRLDARSKKEEAKRLEKEKRLEDRVKEVEEAQEREKKAELTRRSKASGPYLHPSQDLFSHLCEHAPDGKMWMYPAGGGRVLCVHERETGKDVEKGEPIFMVIENTGQPARNIRFSGDVTGISIGKEPDMDSSAHRQFLRYPFDPEQRGKVQKIVMSFETPDGYDLVHTYETRHGFFELRRIDPP